MSAVPGCFRAVLPADFLLVAAMNPCPCGGGLPGSMRVWRRGTAPLCPSRPPGRLLDRFDLRVPVHRPAVEELLVNQPGEPSIDGGGPGRGRS